LSNKQHILITSKGNSLGTAWRELRESGHLLRVLTYRDLKIRYAQTYLGFLWSLLQPLTGLAVVFVLFYKLANLQPQGVPYLAFALSGLIVWNFFSFVVTQSAAVLINMQAMIKKIYFPKLSLPLSKILVGTVDFGVGLLLLVALLLYFGISPGGLWVFIPTLFFMLSAAVGLGMLLSAISIRFRDVQQLIPFLTQMLFFLTPVAYASTFAESLFPEHLSWLFYLNPMAGALSLLRNGLFDLPFAPASYVSFTVSLMLLLLGVWSYVRAEKKMADLL
jgi:lipopolysaccharide transport system permease protein